VRIVGGQWRGRRIKAPPGELVRPTADRVREAWMSILGTALPQARVLDLFAGSGALGLEALSRGAAHVDFVELAPRSLRTLGENIGILAARDRVSVHRQDATRFIAALEPGAYDVAFADPPYGLGLAQRVAEQWVTVPFATLLGIEHRRGEAMPSGGDTRRYGSTELTFYRRSVQPGASRCSPRA
jgi:16S rRNA (guanine966-N2)-methyltransferase